LNHIKPYTLIEIFCQEICLKKGLTNFLIRSIKEIMAALKGKDNWNWKGGISEYPNHSLMKKIRSHLAKVAI